MRAAQQRRYYAQFQIKGPRRRKLWTPEEDARITANNRPTDRKLSKSLRRSVQAIQRLARTLQTSSQQVLDR